MKCVAAADGLNGQKNKCKCMIEKYCCDSKKSVLFFTKLTIKLVYIGIKYPLSLFSFDS